MAEKSDISLRIGRGEWTRLVWAFVISISLHMGGYGGYETGQRLGWWRGLHLPAWLAPEKLLLGALTKKEAPKHEEVVVEVPLVFVDVSSAQSSVEPPKQKPFYSGKNSLATNPATKGDTDTP